MTIDGALAFWRGLDAAQQAWLPGIQREASAPAPGHWVTWECEGIQMGCVSPERAAWLAQQLRDARLGSGRLQWKAQGLAPEERSAQLQAVLERARDAGLLRGWRDERFSFWSADCIHPDPLRPDFLAVERAGFRFLGMRSHAVHVNGFSADGRLWCGRRSLHKATDPGMLDNMTAGGLPAGERIQDCLQRELAEEAGLFELALHSVEAAGHVHTARQEPEGWHDEVVHVFNLTVAPGFVPRNQDGEVAEFVCLQPQAVLEGMRDGDFTKDAVQALVCGISHASQVLATR